MWLVGVGEIQQEINTCIIDLAVVTLICFNPIALKKTKIVYNFGLSECSRVKWKQFKPNTVEKVA